MPLKIVCNKFTFYFELNKTTVISLHHYNQKPHSPEPDTCSLQTLFPIIPGVTTEKGQTTSATVQITFFFCQYDLHNCFNV